MSGISFDPNKIISGNSGKNSSGINFDPNKIISGGDPNPEYVAAEKKVQQKAITTSDSLKNLREDFSAKYLTSPTTQSAAKNLTEIPSYVKSKTTIPSADYDAGYAKQVQLAKEMSEAKRQYETAKANDERTITMKVLDGIGGVSNSVSDAKAKYEAKKKEYETQLSENTERNIQIKYGMTGAEYVEQLKQRKKNAVNDDEKFAISAELKSVRKNLYGESNVFKYIGDSIKEGVTSAAKLLTSTGDFFLGNAAKVLGFENNYFTRLNEEFTKKRSDAQVETLKSAKALGHDSNIIGEVVSGATAAVPDVIITTLMAYLSGGTSLAAKGTQLGSEAIAKANPTFLYNLQKGIQETAKSPIYYTSFIREVGISYEEAMASGEASETQAALAALAAATVNARIEMGGIQELPEELIDTKGVWKKFLNFLTSAPEEGFEEVEQGIISDLTNKVFYDLDKKLYSNTDADAVINPINMAQEFAMGTAVGLLLGGGQLTFNGIIQAKSDSQYKEIGKAVSKTANVQEIIDYSKSATNDDIKILARAVNAKNITDADIGRLYQYAIKDITEKFDDVYTEADFEVVINEYFSSEVSQSIKNIASATFANKLMEMNVEPEQNEIYKTFTETPQNSELQSNTETMVDSESGITADTETNGINATMGAENNSQNSKASNIVDEGGERKVFGTKDGKRHHVTAKEQNYIRKVSNALGFSNDKIIFEHMDKTLGFLADGYYNKKDGTLHIGYSVIDPVTFIFKHELTHFTENTEQYRKFVKAVENSTAFKNWLEARYPELKDKNIEKLIGRYRQEVMDSRAKVAPLKPAEAHAEMIADFVGDILFTEDGSGLVSLSSSLDYEERNVVIQYILDFLSYLKKKLAGNKELVFEISRLEDNFNRAISEATATKKFPTNGGGVQFIVNQENNSSIKQQLAEHKDEINAIGVVFNQRISAELNSKQEAVEWVLSRLGNDVNTVKREGFGEIVLDKKRIKNGMSYLKTKEEIFAFAAVPQVLKNGIEIASHSNHKGRSYDTITFAAPVVINAQRGNMAVVVRQEDKNYYKVHRLLMPDGSQFIFDEKRDTAETAGGVDNNSGLSPTDNVSTDSIPDNQETVNNNSMHESGNNSKNNLQFSFARVYDMSLIKQAEQMEERLKAENKSENEIRKEIWKKIGLIRDTGDVWVYEIDDSKIEFSPYGDALNELSPKVKEFYKLADLGRKTPEKRERYNQLREKYGSPFFRKGKLKDFLKHDALFEKYPQLKETNVEFKMISGPAQYNPETDTIEINAERLLKKNGLKGLDKQIEELVREIEFEDTMVHEIQHAIQHDDKRENGSNVEFWKARLLRGERLPINTETGEEFTPYDAYMATKGEYEARESKNRKNLNEQERREKVPDLGWGKTISARETTNAKNLKFSIPTDTEYMLAVESGDMDTAQWLTDSAAKAAGYTERLYHQTGAEFTEFNTNNQKAGKYDWELPTGTFLKPTDNDIGLEGKKQMELYAKFRNPLTFENRKEARKFWSDNVDGYSEAAKEIQKLNAEYRTKVDEAEADTREYLKKWRRNNPDKDSREIYKDTEYQRLNDIEDGIVDEWEEKDDELSLRAKELINGFISKNDYDGIIVEKDVGSYGRYTKTYIAFESAQMKSAEAVTYDDNGDVIPLSERFNIEQSDIRYSVSTETRDFTEEMNTLNQQLQNGEISAADFKVQVDTLFEEAGEKYGTIKKGEAVTGNENFDDPAPKSVDGRKKIRQHTRTIIEGGKLTSEMLSITKQIVLSGDLSYEPTSNEKNLAYADRVIQSGHAEDRWKKIANGDDKPSGMGIALGEALLKRAVERRDTVAVVELTAELAEVGTRLGQSVQAFSLLKRMDGIGQLYYVQKVVNSLNNDLEKRFGEKAPQIVIDEALAQQLAESKTDEDFQITYTDILKDIASQVPATFLDKWNAWRYMAMLFNPITHDRNFFGNAVFLPAVKIKDIIAYGGERFIDQSERTKSVVIKKEYKEFAKKDFSEIEDAITSGGKMNPKRSIADNKPIFKTEILEKLRKFNFELLEKEDVIFLKLHYQRALGGYLQARGINLKTISPAVLQKAREYAILEAQKATFRDASAMANWLAKGSQKNIGLNILIEGILPFKKTSANVLKRGVEYSPIGLVKTISKAIKDFRSGDFTVSQFIDGLASNLTGTGIFVMGMWLAASGVIRGGSDGDDEDWFDKMLGKQDYSVEIGGISYTVDWLAPACVPFFMGVSVMEGLQAEDNTTAFANFLEGIGAGLSPIIELSMLSGIQETLESVRYAEADEIFISLIGSAAESYFLQALPTIGGKVANLIDPVRRTNYIDKTSSVPEFIQSAVNAAEGKIPFASKLKAEYINAWGEKGNKGNFVKRLFQNFISPGYLSSVEIDDMEAEIKRLAKATANMSVFPDTAPKYVKFKHITKHLNRDDYEVYAVAKGQMSADYVKEAVQSSEYQSLTDEQKAEVITNLYKFANAKAKAKLTYTYEEISAMNENVTEKMYNSYSDNVRKAIVEEYFLQEFKKVFAVESNGGSAVSYYCKKAKED